MAISGGVGGRGVEVVREDDNAGALLDREIERGAEMVDAFPARPV